MNLKRYGIDCGRGMERDGERWREMERKDRDGASFHCLYSLVYLKNFDKFLMLQISIHQILHMSFETGQQIPVEDHMMLRDIT